ncbi:MAG TPA: alpha-glucosidase [Clostridiaceae bacterium]|nr:alpha-glucosidase [Clostridiaceae bacterium]
MIQLSKDSRLGDIIDHPVGHDMCYRLLLELGLNPLLLKNKLLRRLRFRTLAKFSRGQLDDAFMESFFRLLNIEKERPVNRTGEPTPAWWKEATIYQIYPRSFCDSNADGIGDLQGIIGKLDDLKALGVDALWLSPIYRSPDDDNGYDISDYYDIHEDFGTMADFDELIAELEKRDMRLIMDMVLNHTSDEHAWFQEALRDPQSPKRDYYFLRDVASPKRITDKNFHAHGHDDLSPPNNWTSFFRGSAWRYFPDEELWGLHLFSKKQMDLNWESEALRDEIMKILHFWLEKGVSGFRLDVINYISKAEGLPDGNETIGAMLSFYGIEHYVFGAKLNEYLRDMQARAFTPYRAFTVGECPGVGREMSKLLAGEERGEMDLVFSFDHLENPGFTRWDDYCYDLNYYKQYMINEQEALGSNHWMSLFFENHDNPRMISKVNPDPSVREQLGKLLALLLFSMRGTVFLYQGQELGLVNEDFRSMDDIRDVESLNYYQEKVAEGKEEQGWRDVMAGSRDHARTPYPWNDQPYAGFSSVKPWIESSSSNRSNHLKAQQADEQSIWHFYRRLIDIRRRHKGLVYGDVKFMKKKKRHYWACYRTYGDKRYFIEANLSDKPIKRPTGKPQGHLIISTHDRHKRTLQPYEASIIEL